MKDLGGPQNVHYLIVGRGGPLMPLQVGTLQDRSLYGEGRTFRLNKLTGMFETLLIDGSWATVREGLPADTGNLFEK